MDPTAANGNSGSNIESVEPTSIDSGNNDGNSGEGKSDSPENSGNTNGSNGEVSEHARSEYTFNGIPVADAPGIGDGGNTYSGGDAGSSGEYAPGRFNKDGSPAKRRGRKPGQRNGTATPGAARKTAQGNNVSVKGLERILHSIHAIVAVKTACPELFLDPNESKTLAEAINAVQEHYGFEVSPETAIWVNLVTAMGTVYGPRGVSIWIRKKKEKLDKARPRQPEPVKTEQKQDDAGNTFFVIPGMHAPANGPGFL